MHKGCHCFGFSLQTHYSLTPKIFCLNGSSWAIALGFNQPRFAFFCFLLEKSTTCSFKKKRSGLKADVYSARRREICSQWRSRVTKMKPFCCRSSSKNWFCSQAAGRNRFSQDYAPCVVSLVRTWWACSCWTTGKLRRCRIIQTFFNGSRKTELK